MTPYDQTFEWKPFAMGQQVGKLLGFVAGSNGLIYAMMLNAATGYVEQMLAAEVRCVDYKKL